jgi:hypothetical protein
MKTLLSLAALATLVAASYSQTVIMDQIGPDGTSVLTGAGRASQDFEAANNAFDVVMIDDFTTTSTAFRLTRLEAAAMTYGGTNPPRSFANVTGWRVEIYSNTLAAATNLTGNSGSQLVGTGAATYNTAWSTRADSALVTVPINILLAPNTTYWVGLIPVMNFGGGFGQTAIIDSTFAGFPGGLNNVQANPGGGFAIPGNQINRLNNSAYRLTAVPEPASLLAIGVGLAALKARRRRK